MSKFLQRDNIVRTSISPVRTYPIFFENRELFFRFCLKSTCKYLVKTAIEKSHFFKTCLQGGALFENAGVSFFSMISVQSSYRACPISFSIVFVSF